jgi:hypothetical protein
VLVFKKTPDETEKNKTTEKPYRTKKTGNPEEKVPEASQIRKKIEPPILYWGRPM